MTELDIAWFAGLYEGEGCLGYYVDKRGYSSVRLYIESTDEDVIARLYTMWGGRVWESNYPSKPSHYKSSWRWGISNRADVRRIIKEIYPYLGQRRREKCDEVLSKIGAL